MTPAVPPFRCATCGGPLFVEKDQGPYRLGAFPSAPASVRYVYLAGPISRGNQFANVRAALVAGAHLRAAGFAVFIPHRSALDEIACDALPYERWMAEDFAWIERCDALVRLPGESPGSDREAEYARRLGKPVFLGVNGLLAAHSTKEKRP